MRYWWESVRRWGFSGGILLVCGVCVFEFLLKFQRYYLLWLAVSSYCQWVVRSKEKLEIVDPWGCLHGHVNIYHVPGTVGHL